MYRFKSSSFSIGGGISEFATSAESILDSANSFVQKAEGLAGSLDRGLGIPNFATDFNDPASECFGGLKSTGNCGKPKVRIFGGNGFGCRRSSNGIIEWRYSRTRYYCKCYWS